MVSALLLPGNAWKCATTTTTVDLHVLKLACVKAFTFAALSHGPRRPRNWIYSADLASFSDLKTCLICTHIAVNTGTASSQMLNF